MTRGTAENGAVTLWVQSDFVRNMLNKPAVLDPVRETASALLGTPIHHCAVNVGKPPAPGAQAAPTPVPGGAAPEHDNLDDLLAMSQQFDNIIIE